jgi:sugar phosphate isomerase/epimerase
VDRFTAEQAVQFYRLSAAIESAEGLPLAHETHRGRILFNPWITAHILREVPATRLCCDYSHWVVVSERLLDGEEAILELCAKHCRHVHCRVGYPHGPQVPDPSAPEARWPLERHESWWKLIWAAQRQAGATHSSFTPEFGPPDYLHTLPHTNVPVADLATVCEWMRARYEQTYAAWNT